MSGQDTITVTVFFTHFSPGCDIGLIKMELFSLNVRAQG